ncbi:hypothetical protein KBD87_00930 [Candidatus Saccharibacteria bacterium]|nr:hypothetical protein [Candidatus Saccharibacteria bacterium]
MNVAIVFVILLCLLFGFAFLTRRRFGVLGLALAAGAMLSDLWAEKLTPVIAHTGVVVERPPLATVVAATLVLLPAIILFISGPMYRELPARLIGAFLFAILAVALLVKPLGGAMILAGDSKRVYEFFVENQVYIVTIGLIAAIVDILFTKMPRYGNVKHPKH